MTHKLFGIIQEFGGHVEEFAGKKVREQVMEGSETAAKSSNPQQLALYMKEAVDRLDVCASPDQCVEIMAACGHACIAHHAGLANGIRNRRLKYKTEEEFLRAEVAKRPVKGIRLELDGNTLIHYYDLNGYGKPRRCYCALMNSLPLDISASPTYCQCSRGFVEKYWESAVGRPVKVEVVETSLTGAGECKFIIHL